MLEVKEQKEYGTIKDWKPESTTPKLFPLSYSASNELETCEFKYACRKMYKVEPDIEDDTVALRWGSACHKILEDTDWVASNFNLDIYDNALVEYGFKLKGESGKLLILDEQVCYGVYAAAVSLLQLAKKQKLETVACEFEIKLPYLYGFIDRICKEESGGWWIQDLKTSARIMEAELAARLIRDKQLNLYALPEVIEMICNQYNLEAENFRGVRYTVAFKTKAKVKTKEKLKDYTERNQPKVLDFEIPAEKLDGKTILSEHLAKITRASKLRAGLETPIRNYGSNSCFAYNKPCPYFSQCYGKKAEELQSEIKLMTLDNAKKVNTPIREVKKPDVKIENLF